MGNKKKLKKKDRSKLKKNLRKKTLKMKGTISKKQLKKLNKILDKTTQIPELELIRRECNHHYKTSQALISVAEFKQTDKIQFVPELDKYIEAFGEENVMVCNVCLTPVVNPGYITTEDLDKAMLIVSGAIEVIKMNKKLEKKEVKLFYDAKKGIASDVKEIKKRYRKVIDKMELAAPVKSCSSGRGFADIE